jgi:tRNA(Ile)-lysidine synthase
MAETRRLRELVSSILPRLELPNGPLVAALSGGADSAALAYLCVESGVETAALHIDHQLPASPMLAEAAGSVAARIGIALETRQVTVEEGASPEEMARKARYEVFSKSPVPLLTAHTRDDTVETVLINLIRGTGTAGLAGIPPFRPPCIYRPMLAVTGSETREVCTLAGLPYRDDPMNLRPDLTRNRVRHEILPLMRALNPAVDAAIARAASSLRRDHDYLEAQAEALDPGSLTASVLATVPRVLADRLIRRCLESHGIAPTADRIGRVWSVATGESERQDLAAGKTISRRGATLVIE